MLADYRQVYDPLGNSLGLSSIVAALPLVTLFVLLGVLRMRAWLASIIGLAVALIVAVAAYSMPVGDAVNSGLLGAAFGFFPIMWIVINAIWVYNLTVETGHFDVLRRSFASISDDQRIQAVIIAFCFGALMEALAGFGTPVAISSVMLIALGFRPLKAATVALVANTAPVAFGALAVPIITLATVTKLPVGDLGAMVGRQTPILAVFVPLALIVIVIFVVATRVPVITGVAPTKPGAGGTGLESATRIYDWPGLHIVSGKGKAVTTTFNLNILSAAGTLLLLSVLLTMIVLKIGVGRAVRAYGRTLAQLKFAILTVMAVLALGFVMNESGQTTTLGLW